MNLKSDICADLRVHVAADVVSTCKIKKPFFAALTRTSAQLMVVSESTLAQRSNLSGGGNAKISPDVMTAAIHGLRVGSPAYFTQLQQFINGGGDVGRVSTPQAVAVKFHDLTQKFACNIFANPEHQSTHAYSMRADRSATEAGKWKLFDREVDFIRAKKASNKKTKELVLTENADL